MEFTKIQAVIADALGCDEAEVTMEASLKDDLGADSLAAVEMSMALEEEFDVTIDDDQLPNFKTVADVVAYLKANEA